ncbi:MAG: bifunctional class I SAM-dependent methyltransferase/glycosyltransferase family 2 protein [Desulfobacterales bacterium]|nr:bifunctional class I SAM-dependent methyltransferase/glycosyltransferase family 2 protein [Desulfobacterales bacterium]
MKTKELKRAHFDRLAPQRDRWKEKNRYYYDDLEELLSFLVPPGRSVLEVGCSTGDLLAHLRPKRGLGIDFSKDMIAMAREKYPRSQYPFLSFIRDDVEDLQLKGETFAYVIMSDLIGELTDIGTAFRNLARVTTPESRLIITYFNALWEPILGLGEKLGLKMPQDHQNWLSPADIENLLALNGFEVIKKGERLLFPKRIPILARLVNTYLARLPLVRKLCLGTYLVARPRPETRPPRDYSVTVVIPCRNERGNIRAAVARIPEMGSHTEIIFVDGNSSDGTVEEIEAVIKEYRDRREIKLLHQVEPGSDNGSGHGRMLKLGKGDAVRKGFAAASGEILMILDADLTVPPEDLPKFYQALQEGHGELINGTRLVYPMEKEAMRFLNKLGNKFFSMLFTWFLDQRIKDTLCGTKVLFKKDYDKIAENRSFFGDFDPFGDFDLLFGAVKQNLKIVEVPIRYRERTYGDIKIDRFRHGLLLLKMSFVAMKKLKFR